MGYQNNGSRTKKEDVVWGINPDTGEAYLEPNLAQVRNINSHFNIEIPLYYKRILGEKLFVLIGTSSILNISNTQTSIQYNADGSKKEIHGKTIVLSLGNLIFQEILDLVLTI